MPFLPAFVLEACYVDNGISYTANVSITQSNRTCMHWDVQEPHNTYSFEQDPRNFPHLTHLTPDNLTNFIPLLTTKATQNSSDNPNISNAAPNPSNITKIIIKKEKMGKIEKRKRTKKEKEKIRKKLKKEERIERKEKRKR